MRFFSRAPLDGMEVPPVDSAAQRPLHMHDAATFFALEVGSLSDFLVAGATLFLGLTAIFGERMRTRFNSTKVDLRLPASGALIEDLARGPISSSSPHAHLSSASSPQASAYRIRVEVANVGRTDAADCRICITAVRFRPHNQGRPWNTNDVSREPLRWCGREDSRATIRRSRSEHVDIFILPSETSTLTSSSALAPEPTPITIGRSVAPRNVGSWEVDLEVDSGNLREPLRRSLTISWDGQWESRETEMRHRLEAAMQKENK